MNHVNVNVITRVVIRKQALNCVWLDAKVNTVQSLMIKEV